MAQPFSFGFSGDDIEVDPNDAPNVQDKRGDAPAETAPPPIPARTHDLDELVGKMSCLVFSSLCFSCVSLLSLFLLNSFYSYCSTFLLTVSYFISLPTPSLLALLISSSSLHVLLTTPQLSHIPDKLSYTLLRTKSPKGLAVRLPRRDLFDVRLQLMAEDPDPSTSSTHSSTSASASSSTTTTNNAPLGLNESDVQTNIYEGGYKTWECSIDLLKFLLDRGPRKDLDDMARVHHVIEMGCGTALPSLLLFQYALKNSLQLSFTMTDYNADVLRLVTVPNLLLAFASTLPAEAEPFSEENPNPLAERGVQFETGDLYITPAFLSTFKSTISSLGISFTLVSGSWTPVPTLLSLIPSAEDLNTFVIASETIYSPASLASFTEAMVGLLKRVKSGKAVVAAKRVYFGVGGSVDGFKEECSRHGCVAYEMDFEGLDSGGVRRALVEVQMY
jgi:protein-histidine N-methyltransferase